MNKQETQEVLNTVINNLDKCLSLLQEAEDVCTDNGKHKTASLISIEYFHIQKIAYMLIDKFIKNFKEED